MRRILPGPKSIKRRKAQGEPKFRIVVVCEGEKTEPAYLRDFARHNGNGLVDVVLIPKGGVPLTLVEKAVEIKRKLVMEARRSGDSFDKKFQVWGMPPVSG